MLQQRPAALLVAGNELTLPRRRGHLAFPSTGKPQQNAAQQLTPRTHTHTALAIYIHPTVWVRHHAPINPPVLEQKYKRMCVHSCADGDRVCPVRPLDRQL